MCVCVCVGLFDENRIVTGSMNICTPEKFLGRVTHLHSPHIELLLRAALREEACRRCLVWWWVKKWIEKYIVTQINENANKRRDNTNKQKPHKNK